MYVVLGIMFHGLILLSFQETECHTVIMREHDTILRDLMMVIVLLQFLIDKASVSITQSNLILLLLKL